MTMPKATTRLRGRCPCGATVEVEAPAGYEQAALIVASCPACSDRQLIDAGGTILATPALPAGPADQQPLFNLGRVAVTAGAVAALAEAGLDALAFVARHASGDFGSAGRASEIEVTEVELRRGPLATADDGKLNVIAIRLGRGRILSSYELPTADTLWVLTELGEGMPITTILLPDEY